MRRFVDFSLMNIFWGCAIFLALLACSCGGSQKKENKSNAADRAAIEKARKEKNQKAAADADCAIAIMKNAQEGTPIPERCKRTPTAAQKGKAKVRRRAYSGSSVVKPREETAKEKVESAPPPVATKPAWVRSGKVDMPGYYVGIGEGPDWQTATARAFDQVAAQLKVTVKAETRNVFKEKNITLFKGKAAASRVEERTDENTDLLVDQTLEGVEIAERYTNNTRYWILARLSKAKLKEMLEQKLEQAKESAISAFKSSAKSLGQGDVVGALRHYVKAFTALRAFQGGLVKADVNGDGAEEVLNSELYARMQRLLDGIKLRAENPELSAVAGGAPSEQLVVVAEYEGKPVRRLPLIVRFVEGSGKADSGVATGDDGKASIGLSKVFGKPEAVVAVSIDLRALCDEPSLEYRALKSAFSSDLERGSAKARIRLKAAKVYVHLDVRNLGRRAGSSIVEDIKDVLSSKLGLEFTSKESEATMAITGKVNTGKCKDFFEQRKCKATARITVKDLAAGAELFSKTVTASGTDPKSDKAAGMDALSKVGKKIGKSLAKKLKR